MTLASAMSELREIRLDLGYTQAVMAEALGVDLRTYQRHEALKHGKPVYTLAARCLQYERRAR